MSLIIFKTRVMSLWTNNISFRKHQIQYEKLIEIDPNWWRLKFYLKMKLYTSFCAIYSVKSDPNEQSNTFLRSTHDSTNRPTPLQDQHMISVEQTTMLLRSTHDPIEPEKLWYHLLCPPEKSQTAHQSSRSAFQHRVSLQTIWHEHKHKWESENN